MYFALYRTTIDASSSPHVGIVCLWCHWPSTASSTATVLTSRALDNSHINHMIASSIELPSCPRHDLGVSPSCYCHLNRIFRSTKHDIRASMYDKIGFCPLWLHFHFLYFVCFSEILDTERMKFELTRIPKIDISNRLFYFTWWQTIQTLCHSVRYVLRNTIIVCLYDSKTKTLT